MFIVRYKINNKDYTQWYNTNASFLIDEYHKEVIQSNGGYFINADNEKKLLVENTNGSLSFDKVYANVSNDVDIVKSTKRITLSDLSDYNKIQIGVIIITKTYTKTLISNDIDVDSSVLKAEDLLQAGYNVYDKSGNFDINSDNVISKITAINLDLNNFNNAETATELIKTYKNYYNVSCFDNVDNRVYIAGYNEKVDKEIDNNLIEDINIEPLFNNTALNVMNQSFRGFDYKDFIDYRTLIPGNTYNIYIHYVDKYGISTAGYFVKSILVNIDDDRLKPYIPSDKDNLMFFNVTLNVSNVKLPTDYVGYYLSYEKVKDNVKFVGYKTTERAKDYENNEDFVTDGNVTKIYTTDIDTNNSLSIDFDKMFYKHKDEVYYNKIKDKEFVDGNSSNNIGQWSSCKIKLEGLDKSDVNIEIINKIDKLIWNRIKHYYTNKTFIGFINTAYSKDAKNAYINMVNNDNFTYIYPKHHFHADVHKVRSAITNALLNESTRSVSNIVDIILNYKIYKGRFNMRDYIRDVDNLSNDIKNIFDDNNVSFTNINDFVILTKDENNVVNNKQDKVLIPFTSVVYEPDGVKQPIFYYDGFITPIDFYRSIEFTQVSSDGRVVVVDYMYGNNNFDKHHNAGNPNPNEKYKVGIEHKKCMWIKKIPDYYKVINSKPTIVFAPDNVDSKTGTIKTFKSVSSVNGKDLFKVVHLTLDEAYPKVQYNYRKDIKSINRFDKTIRRSNVIQNESFENAWRKFDTEAYHKIDENKGKITNIFSINEMFIIHTEHSLFGMNLSDNLVTENKEVYLGGRDIFDVKHKELFTTKLGYGGLSDKNQSIVGTFGYVWFNDATKRFMYLSGNSPKFIDDDIFEYTQKVGINNVKFVNDYNRRRLIINYDCYDNKKQCISYDYISNNFISFHNYNFDRGINTETGVLLYNNKFNKVFGYSETSFGYTDIVNPTKFINSKISFVINPEYDTIKYIEHVTYKVTAPITKRVDDNYDTSPVEEVELTYSGDTIRVYNNFIDTGIVDITIDKTKFNKVIDYTKPYRELGNWNINYLRDIKNNNYNKVIDDVSSRLYGNYFVVDMTFDKPDNTDRIEIETFDVTLSKT